MDYIPISKIADRELPVPSEWRLALKALADSIVLKSRLQPVKSFMIDAIDDRSLQISYGNIDDYPDPLGPLSAVSWDSSICVWHEGYWAVLVDLTTATGDVSDLVLHAKVSEKGDTHLIEPGHIYVP